MKNKNVAYFNESAYFVEVRKAEAALPQIQILIKEFSTLGLFELDTISQIKCLIEDGSKYIKAQLEQLVKEEQPKIGKFKMKASSIVDTLDLPDLDQIDSLCFALRNYAYMVPQFYDYTQGKISINNSALDSLRERYSIIAKTPAQIKLVECHKLAADALDKLSSALGEAGCSAIDMQNRYGDLFFAVAGRIEVREVWYQANWHMAQKHAERS